MAENSKSVLSTQEPSAGSSAVTDVTATAPITSTGGTTPDIAITPATTSAAGSMSAADKTKLDGLPVTIGDMLAATYDPTGQSADVYDYENALGITQVTGTIITPPTLTATANDYSPTGFSTCNIIRQDIDANNRQITGFPAPAVGVNRIIRVNNINSAGLDLRFQNNDAGSVAANRILVRDNTNKSVKPNETAAFWYDHTSSRWRAFTRIG